jgi:hypothetical protein
LDVGIDNPYRESNFGWNLSYGSRCINV